MTKRRANLSLIFITALWGVSFYFARLGIEDLGIMSLNAYRFLFAFIFLCFFSMQRIIKVNTVTLKYSILSGIPVVLAYLSYSYGILNTSLSNAAFLCCLAVLFTPIFSFIIDGIVPSRKLIFALFICIPGIALITINGSFVLSSGDFFCILCAVLYALTIIIMEKGVNTNGVDAYNLAAFQLGFVGLCYLLLAFIFDDFVLPSSTNTILVVAALSILCTAITTVIQSIAQKYTSATNVGLIFTLEPIFASIASYFLANEVMTTNQILGAITIISSILILEIRWTETRIYNMLFYKTKNATTR